MAAFSSLVQAPCGSLISSRGLVVILSGTNDARDRGECGGAELFPYALSDPWSLLTYDIWGMLIVGGRVRLPDSQQSAKRHLGIERVGKLRLAND